MTIEKPPYSFAAKYDNQLISESRGQSLCGLYFFLHDFWRFSNVLPRCLDVGCGTGGVFQFWDSSQLDPQSCGIDPASEMIALASVNCPQFEFESTDLLAFDSANRYDWIVCTGNPINYITPDDRRRFFKKAGELLAPGGLLYFDFDTRLDIEGFWPGQTRVVENLSFKFEAKYTYDAEQDVGIEKQYWSEIQNSEKVFSETHYLYPISPDEIILEMKGAKFQEPIFCDPEDYIVVAKTANFLALGCLVRVADG